MVTTGAYQPLVSVQFGKNFFSKHLQTLLVFSYSLLSKSCSFSSKGNEQF